MGLQEILARVAANIARSGRRHIVSQNFSGGLDLFRSGVNWLVHRPQDFLRDPRGTMARGETLGLTRTE